MKVQSLSLVIPTNKCINNCPFCVSKMHDNDYSDITKIADQLRFDNQYIKRLEYARENGINVVILTGTGEALQNTRFLTLFSQWNKKIFRPFHVIELQTSGVLLEKNLDFLKNTVGVETISLSVSDLFCDSSNMDIIGVASSLRFKLDELCKKIKDAGLNLRISLNVLDVLGKEVITINSGNIAYANIEKIFKRLRELDADQVTFRKIWSSTNTTPEDKWINEHTMKETMTHSTISIEEFFFSHLHRYIADHGRILGRLTFGSVQYSVNEISTVVDIDCMNDKEIKEEYKYLILRENGKLYTRWDDKGSLVF